MTKTTKYLGMNFKGKAQEYCEENYKIILYDLKKDMNKWLRQCF